MRMMQMMMEIWMGLSLQIKATVMILIPRTMENLPFLSQTTQSPNVLSSPSESEPEPPRFVEKPTPLHVPFQFKEHQLALVLIGIVIGVVLMNMRPIIINPVMK